MHCFGAFRLQPPNLQRLSRHATAVFPYLDCSGIDPWACSLRPYDPIVKAVSIGLMEMPCMSDLSRYGADFRAAIGAGQIKQGGGAKGLCESKLQCCGSV